MNENGVRLGSPVDRPSLVLLGVIGAFLLLDAYVIATTPFLAPHSAVVRESLFAVSWIGVGVVALLLRRASLARRILTLSLVLTADFVGSFALQGDEPLLRAMVTLTAILVPLQTPVGGHLVLSYPTGRVEERVGRRLVAASYVAGGIEAAWWGLAHEGVYRCGGCTQNVAILDTTRSVQVASSLLFAVVWVIVAGFMVALLIVRYRRAGHRQRRLLRLPYVSILAAILLYGILSAFGCPQGN